MKIIEIKKQKTYYAVHTTDGDFELDGELLRRYHLTEGMEFDAVIVCWPDCTLTDGERRRLYTSCSRALHAAALLGGSELIKELGIVL